MIEQDQPQPEFKDSDPLDQAIEKLQTTQLGARKDLKISRHLFRGEPSYIIHDPINFQSHRFSQSDYVVFSTLDRTKTVDSIYQQLVANGDIKEDPRKFYEFILGLQMRGLLDLPVLDGERLYDRYRQREALKNKKSLMKLVFIKIPLFNPNAFLDRTLHLARPLFTKAFFGLFILMFLGAIGLLVTRWEDFYSPFANLLATRNLIILVVVMTVLKFWHELGHGYACKINGGAVPDMGALLMAGMPMAYVDVSSSWSFTSRFQRILVGLGGMYFEGIAAAIAMYVWAFTSPGGLVNSTAHFVVLMASFMTLLFNANPLMRYDGYYILSDLTGIPNLRGRSTQYASGVMKWLTLGLPMKVNGKSYREMAWMLTYGVAAVIYQAWLMLVIAFMIASQLFLVGLAIAAMFMFTTIVLPIKKAISYLWFAPETAPIRPRALAVSALLIAFLAAAIIFIPVPGSVVSTGQLTHEKVQSIRIPFDCVIEEVHASPNDEVEASSVVLKVTNPEIQERKILAEAEKTVADRMVLASSTMPAAEQKVNMLNQIQAERVLNTAETLAQHQIVKAVYNKSKVLSFPTPQDVGRFVRRGEELGQLGAGERIVRVLMSEREIALSQVHEGDKVSVRLTDATTDNTYGTVTRIEPSGNESVQMAALTHNAGGRIIADKDGVTESIYYIVEIAFSEPHHINIPEYTTAYVQFGRRFEPLGFCALRHLRIFVNKLFAG